MDPILKLKETKPLTTGAVRWVFAHPHDPDLIVKVIREDAIKERYGKNVKWYKMKRRYDIYLSYMREIQEFLAVHANNRTNPPFLQRIVGFAQTDMGLGLVLEGVKDKSGKELAPTLRMLINSGQYDETVETALETFFSNLLECDEIVINDLNPGNMVYTYSEALGHYFTLIDGLGNNSPIPLKTISKTLNRRAKQRRFEALREKVIRYKERSKLYK